MKNIYTKREHFKPGSEQIILFGLLDECPKEDMTNHLGHSRYHNLIEYCKDHYTYVTDPESADVFVLPFKFRGTSDPVYLEMSNLAKKHKKQLWCFYHDDDATKFTIPEHVVLFRTNMTAFDRLSNELPMITVAPDCFRNRYLESPELSIGFCGWMKNGRKPYLDFLKNSDLKTDFVYREDFWGGRGLTKQKALEEFNINLENNLFAFCIRGVGNYSWRFFQILMMGRIPVFVNTNTVIPYWDMIRTHNIGLILNQHDVMHDKQTIVSAVKEYYERHKHELVDIQKNNRKLYETYFSPCGFLKTIDKYI